MTDEFIRHLMKCTKCFGAGGRYCTEGITLKLDADSDYISSLKTVEERRKWMEFHKRSHPHLQERLQELVTKKFQSVRVGEVAR